MAMFAEALSNFDPCIRHKIQNRHLAKQGKIVCLFLFLNFNIIVTLKTRDIKQWSRTNFSLKLNDKVD